LWTLAPEKALRKITKGAGIPLGCRFFAGTATPNERTEDAIHVLTVLRRLCQYNFRIFIHWIRVAVTTYTWIAEDAVFIRL
jgi:hypothetical protein